MNLFVNIGANIRGLAGKLNEGLTRVRRWARDVNRATGGLFGGLVGAASFAGLTRVFRSMVNDLDDIGKAARRVRVTTDEFQAMQYAADRSGVSVDVLGKATQEVTSRLGEARQGVGQAKRAFELLGIDLEYLAKLPAYERMIFLANALRQVTDESMRASIMKDIFGRAAREIEPLLFDLDKLNEDFQKLGRIIDADTIKAAERLKDTMTDLKTVLRSIVADTGIVEHFADTAQAMQDLIRLRGELNKRLEEEPDTFRKMGIAERLKEAYKENFRQLKDGGFAERASALTVGTAAQFLAGPKVAVMQTQTPEELRSAGERQRQSATEAAEAEAEKRRVADEAAKLAAVAQEDERIAKEREAAEKRAQAERDQAAKIGEQIGQVERRAELQRMRQQGLEREAFILEQIDRLEKERTLNEEELARARRAAGELFEAQQREAAESAESAVMDAARVQPRGRSSYLESIGAIFGGRAQTDPVPRQQLDELRRSTRHLAGIEQKIEATDGGRFI